MKKVVRFIAQCIDADSGELIEESIMNEEVLSKAETLKGLGYTEASPILTYAANLYTMSSTVFQSLNHDSLR